MGQLDGKVAIITGASSGMGRDSAKLFCAEGANVIGFARRKERLEEVQKMVEDAGSPGKFIFCTGDARNDDDVKAVVDMAIEKFGKVDILLNAAGMNDNMKLITEVDNEWLQYCMDMNFTAPFKMIREAMPHMIENGGGNIINIGSVGSVKGGNAGVCYIAAKHAVLGMTRQIAVIHFEDGIRCNCVLPGAYQSECVPTADASPVGKQRTRIVIPSMRKYGNTQQIATVCLFLASEASMDVNGVALPVDSGWTAV